MLTSIEWMMIGGVAAALSGCCFGGGTSPAQDFAPIPDMAPPIAVTPPTPITLAPGFAPDPQVIAGSGAGGPLDAETLSDSCAGYIDLTRPHLLTLAAALPNLTITAHSETDLVLVVQRPDGTYACNDDFHDFDPGMMGPAAAGAHRIWVGTFGSTGGAAYTLSIGTALPGGAVTGGASIVAALNEICGDAWCEGEWDYTFTDVSCDPAPCRVTFDARRGRRTVHDTVVVDGVNVAGDQDGPTDQFAERFTDVLMRWERRH